MAGLDPATHAERQDQGLPAEGAGVVRHELLQQRQSRVGDRVTPGHDEFGTGVPSSDEAAPESDDAEDEAPETGPLRRCIVTRERLEKAAMIRFVIGPDRTVVPDLAARLPGRGIWLSAKADVLETARAKGGFARAARGPVNVPANLAEIVRTGLLRRITELLGLTRRAGQAIAGFEKAQATVRAGRAGLVVQAADGSAEECARFRAGAPDSLRVIAPLDGAALGAVFGRDRVVHVAVTPGRLADALAQETARLAGVMAPATGLMATGLTKAAGGNAGQTRRPRPADKRTGA